MDMDEDETACEKPLEQRVQTLAALTRDLGVDDPSTVAPAERVRLAAKSGTLADKGVLRPRVRGVPDNSPPVGYGLSIALWVGDEPPVGVSDLGRLPR